jgi:hypothetical protein
MFDVRCSMFDVRCSMFDVRCSMFNVFAIPLRPCAERMPQPIRVNSCDSWLPPLNFNAGLGPGVPGGLWQSLRFFHALDGLTGRFSASGRSGQAAAIGRLRGRGANSTAMEKLGARWSKCV